MFMKFYVINELGVTR